uniref:Uncharacterized protein n=1 Tax=Salmo trutta TaxID=8032 RepID=A0A674CF47_SALTR
ISRGGFDSDTPNISSRDFGNRCYHGRGGGNEKCNNNDSSPAYTPNPPHHSQNPGQHMDYQVNVECFWSVEQISQYRNITSNKINKSRLQQNTHMRIYRPPSYVII